LRRRTPHSLRSALVRPRRIAHVIATEIDNPFGNPRIVGAMFALTAALTILCRLQRSGNAPRARARIAI
jgi:hypothetical protein